MIFPLGVLLLLIQGVVHWRPQDAHVQQFHYYPDGMLSACYSQISGSGLWYLHHPHPTRSDLSFVGGSSSSMFVSPLETDTTLERQ